MERFFFRHKDLLLLDFLGVKVYLCYLNFLHDLDPLCARLKFLMYKIVINIIMLSYECALLKRVANKHSKKILAPCGFPSTRVFCPVLIIHGDVITARQTCVSEEILAHLRAFIMIMTS
jgi:hypothetical protein